MNRGERYFGALAVDTLGFVLLGVVTAAKVQDPEAGRRAIGSENPIAAPTSDLGRRTHAGSMGERVRGLRRWGRVRVEVVQKAKGQQGFVVVPRVVDCGGGRSPGGDAVGSSSPITSECRRPRRLLFNIAMIRLMLRRLSS